METKQIDEASLAEWMAQRVAEKLRCPASDIDPSASIMAMGIDSMALIGLAADLAELLGRDVDAELIWEHDSIGALAVHLMNDGKAEETSSTPEPEAAPEPEKPPVRVTDREGSLQLLRDGSEVAPVVAVGHLKMATLIKEGLSPQVPVCLVQLDSPKRPPYRLRPVAEMAADFAEQLERAFPAVPLTLVGYSFGGVVAFDLACRLRSRGRDVRLVLLEPAPFRRDGWVKKLGRHLRAAGELSWPGRVRYVWTKSLGLCSRASTGLTQRVRRVLPRHELEVEVEGHSEPGPEPHDGRKVFKDGLASSLRGYQPPRFNGEAVLAGRPSWLGESRRTWARLVEQELDVIPLDASDHLAIMETGDTTAWLDAIRRRHEGERSRGDDRPASRGLSPARQRLSMT